MVGAMAMPHGNSPTWMVLITFCAATSITETSLDTPLVTSRCFSSGVKAMCQTRCPTSRYLITACASPHRPRRSRLAGPSAMKAVLASRVMPMPTGWIASRRRPGIFEGRSCRSRHALDGIDHRHRAADLGRDPQFRAVALEFGKARPCIDQHVCRRSRRVVVSMKCAMFVVSDVLIRILAVRADRHAFGLDADLHVADAGRAYPESITVTVLSFSLAT